MTITVVTEPPQASGEYRGTATVTMDDGRVIGPEQIRADNFEAWTALLLVLEDQMIAAEAVRDADLVVDNDEQIVGDSGLAKKQEQALAYLRRAYGEDTLTAYGMYLRAKEYVVAEGLKLRDIFAHLEPFGLTQEEWDLWKDRYQHLTDPANAAAIVAYEAVVAGDPGVN